MHSAYLKAISLPLCTSPIHIAHHVKRSYRPSESIRYFPLIIPSAVPTPQPQPKAEGSRQPRFGLLIPYPLARPFIAHLSRIGLTAPDAPRLIPRSVKGTEEGVFPPLGPVSETGVLL